MTNETDNTPRTTTVFLPNPDVDIAEWYERFALTDAEFEKIKATPTARPD